MASEFEQTKRDVNGRSVMITSWFDGPKNGWRASAPSYANVGGGPAGNRDTCRTRQAAIDQVVHTLVRHFADATDRSTERLIFLY